MNTSILIADDDERILSTFARHLAQAGYNVLTAVDGEKALQSYDREQPDIALIDVRMPHMDGFEVLQAIRERDPDAEVLLVTGHGDMDMAIEALRAGASDFIPKPVEQAALDAALRHAQERLRLKRELGAARADLERYAADLEARNLELRQTQARLIREENLALLGNLAVALSHEINNPLAAIKTAAAVVNLRIKNDACIHRQIDVIDRGIARISAVLARIFEVPRPRLVKMDRLDVNDIVESALRVARDQGFLDPAGDITLVVDLAPDLPPVQGHFYHLRQAFLNVILNGAEALAKNEPGQVCVLTVITAHILSTGGRPPHTLPSGCHPPSVQVRFADTGPGIPGDALERVFDPDYTTKIKQGEVQGLGLGLLVARGVAEIHGGKLALRNRPRGSGVTVTIDLPVELATNAT